MFTVRIFLKKWLKNKACSVLYFGGGSGGSTPSPGLKKSLVSRGILSPPRNTKKM